MTKGRPSSLTYLEYSSVFMKLSGTTTYSLQKRDVLSPPQLSGHNQTTRFQTYQRQPKKSDNICCINHCVFISNLRKQTNQSTLKVCVNFSCSPKHPFFQKYKSAMPQFFINDPIFQSFLSWFTFSMKIL
jgi:hypothetical protein